MTTRKATRRVETTRVTSSERGSVASTRSTTQNATLAASIGGAAHLSGTVSTAPGRHARQSSTACAVVAWRTTEVAAVLWWGGGAGVPALSVPLAPRPAACTPSSSCQQRSATTTGTMSSSRPAAMEIGPMGAVQTEIGTQWATSISSATAAHVPSATNAGTTSGASPASGSSRPVTNAASARAESSKYRSTSAKVLRSPPTCER